MWRTFVVVLLPPGMYPEGSFPLEVSRAAHEPTDSSTEDDDMPSLIWTYGITTRTVGGMFGCRTSQRCAGCGSRNSLRETWMQIL